MCQKLGLEDFGTRRPEWNRWQSALGRRAITARLRPSPRLEARRSERRDICRRRRSIDANSCSSPPPRLLRMASPRLLFGPASLPLSPDRARKTFKRGTHPQMTESGLSVGCKRTHSSTSTFRKVSGLTLATSIEVSGLSPNKIERCSPTPRHPAGASDMERRQAGPTDHRLPSNNRLFAQTAHKTHRSILDSCYMARKAGRCRSRQDRVLVKPAGATKGAQQRVGP